MRTNFTTVIECPCCGERTDASVEAELSGAYRKATRLDPEEWPEVDDITVTVGEGVDVTESLPQSVIDALQSEACENAAEDEAAARADAEERRAEERRDARMWRD